MSIEQDEHEEEQDFEAAFNHDDNHVDEGDTEQAAEDSSMDNVQDEVNDTDLSSDSEGDPEDDTDSQAQGDSESTSDVDVDLAQADDGLEDVPEEDKPRAKSWEGRLKKREEELKKLEDELRLKQEPNVDEPTDDDSKDEFKPEDGSEIAEVLGDFPELADPIAKIISTEVKKATEAVRNEFRQQLDPVTQQLNESREAAEQAVIETHFATITEQHPDYKEIVESDALNSWIDNLPHREAVKYERVCNEGTAAEVVEMLSRLKSDRQKESKKDALNQRRNIQKQAGQSIPKHSSKVDDKKGKIDMNDFDAGFEDD